MTDAVLASAAEGVWVEVPATEARLAHCLDAGALARGGRWLRRRHGFEAVELAAWPQLGDRPFIASHIAADGFDEAEAERARAALEENGLELSALAYYDNNLHPDPGEREQIHNHLRA